MHLIWGLNGTNRSLNCLFLDPSY